MDSEVIQALNAELAAFYDRASRTLKEPCVTPAIRTLWEAMDAYEAAHPDASTYTLKARLYEEIAERFEPLLFPHSPFFYETQMRTGESWGTPQSLNAGAWLWRRRRDRRHAERPDLSRPLQRFNINAPGPAPHLWNTYGDGFDSDHYSLAYTTLLEIGIDGLVERIDRREAEGDLDAKQAEFLDGARRGCRAVLKIAAKFADEADAMLARGGWDADAERCLGMIAHAARRVPARPPETFYEGLAMMWFLRQTTGTLEGIGVSVIGHIDRHLIGLYEADRAAGRIDEAQARDLIARWMAPTDRMFLVETCRWPESSTCLELGGCDRDGEPVWNDLTRLTIETHLAHNFINPKLNCRVSAASPQEYLDLIGRALAEGHNVFALQNDDVLIPALVRSGKTVEDARLYVNGGCQETVVEGVEHSAGAFYYFNMARALDMSLTEDSDVLAAMREEGLDACLPRPIADAATFDDFYDAILEQVCRYAEQGAAWGRDLAVPWDGVNPCPFYSASMAGCLGSATDYTIGGAKYNRSGLGLVGFATIVDSLAAVRSAVYDKEWLTMDELREALATNWEGCEALRARMASLPKFGHGDAETDALAARFARDVAAFACTVPNERGEMFQPNLFVYYQFVHMGKLTRATPDGRRDGDLLSQGSAPARVRPPEAMTDIFRSLSCVDFTAFPGNAVVDMQLPMSGVTPEAIAAMIRTFCDLGGATIQPNCVSIDTLREAQEKPEQHADLTVRISGLSARFVALERSVQQEIIERTMAKC